MNIARELVWTALFNLLSPLSSFSTTSRRVQLAQDGTPLVPIDQPALFLVEGHETTINDRRGVPPKHLLQAGIWIWAKIPDGLRAGQPDQTTPGATVLNPLLDAVETALAPDDVTQNVLTLGGLVSHCWIEGETVKVVGDLNPDGQCFAAMPIRILVP